MASKVGRPKNPGSFKKGDARINRTGRPKLGNSLAEKFRDALAEHFKPDGDYTKLDSVIDMAVTQALKGDKEAREFVIARGYGKLIDRVESVNHNVNYDFTHMTVEERKELLEKIRSARRTDSDTTE